MLTRVLEGHTDWVVAVVAGELWIVVVVDVVGVNERLSGIGMFVIFQPGLAILPPTPPPLLVTQTRKGRSGGT